MYFLNTITLIHILCTFFLRFSNVHQIFGCTDFQTN